MIIFARVVLLLCFLHKVTLAKKLVKDVIGFPEQEENLNSVNKDNRQPVYIPSMCPINQLYYPGDQKDDWICDCRPAYLYHPASDTCWPAYKRGPCAEGQYLVLRPNEVLPVCAKNPCSADNYVLWNNNCEKLGSTKPCTRPYPAASALEVNATSMLVGCVIINVQSRFSDGSDNFCPPGCKRRINGKCQE